MLLNKRGTDKLLSVYWFAILFIVAGAIFYMVTVHSGKSYDVREIEANAMINKISDCLSEGGKLKADWKTISSTNIFQRCSLTFDVEDTYGWNNNQNYVEINYKSFDGNWQTLLFSGNTELKNFCNKKGKMLPFCLERSFYVLDVNDRYIIKILSVVGKAEKNV